MSGWKLDPIEPVVLFDLLLLVTETEISLDVIRSWTAAECEEVEKWASATYERAGDHCVRVPPKPAAIKAVESEVQP